MWERDADIVGDFAGLGERALAYLCPVRMRCAHCSDLIPTMFGATPALDVTPGGAVVTRAATFMRDGLTLIVERPVKTETAERVRRIVETRRREFADLKRQAFLIFGPNVDLN